MCPSAGIAHQIAIETGMLLNRIGEHKPRDKVENWKQTARTLPFVNLHISYCMHQISDYDKIAGNSHIMNE